MTTPTTAPAPATEPAAEQSALEPTQSPETAPLAPAADQAPAEAATALEAMSLGEVRAEAVRRGFSTVTKGSKDQMIAAMRATEDAAPAPAEEPEDEPTEEAGSSALADGCAAGTIRLYRMRASGTYRRIPWLSGQEREYAEFFRMLTETGASVREVAEQCGVSRATVRRHIWTLDLMDDISAGNLDELCDADVLATGELVLEFTDEEGDE